MTRKIRIISVGGGWVVNNRHLLALKQSGLFEVVGVISNDEERAKKTAAKHGIKNWGIAYDPENGWQRESDAVMIGTVPHVHHIIAKQALNAGKHVITEKPMTIDLKDARELDQLARDKKLTLAVVHNFQFSRAAKAFRRDLESGKIGKIQTVYGVQLCNHARNIPAWCDQLPQGLFFDEAPHFYYLFRSICGSEIKLRHASIWKSRKTQNTPRLINAEYSSADGYPILLHINFDSSLTEWHVTVVGENGVADIDVWRDIYVRLPNDGSHGAVDILRTSISGAVQHFWGVLTGGIRHIRKRHLYGNDQVVRNFHRAIMGAEDALKGMNASEGMRVVEHMHELIEMAEYLE